MADEWRRCARCGVDSKWMHKSIHWNQNGSWRFMSNEDGWLRKVGQPGPNGAYLEVSFRVSGQDWGEAWCCKSCMGELARQFAALFT